jgi:hypothetical protein
MHLLELWAGWNRLEVWSQIGIIACIGGAIIGIAGLKTDLFILSYLLLMCGICLLAYGTIRQSRKLSEAKSELDKINRKIDQTAASVYAQKNEEIAKLETDVTAWKSAASFKERVIENQNKAEKSPVQLNSEIKT